MSEGPGAPEGERLAERPPGAQCRCEATMPAAVLDGFSCGLPGCWRAPLVQASFATFVADLIRARGEEPPAVEDARG